MGVEVQLHLCDLPLPLLLMVHLQFQHEVVEVRWEQAELDWSCLEDSCIQKPLEEGGGLLEGEDLVWHDWQDPFQVLDDQLLLLIC